MKGLIYRIFKNLHKRGLCPYFLWSLVYDKCHRSVDREYLW